VHVTYAIDFEYS